MKNLKDIADRSPLSLEKLVWIEEYILRTGYMTPEVVRRQLEWFVIDLGIDEYYFRTTPVSDLARHLITLSASELITRHGGEGVGIKLINEREDRALYIVEDTAALADEVEERIDERYPSFRLESYITKKLPHGEPLRFYVLTKPQFKPTRRGCSSVATFEDVANETFLARAVPETASRYRAAWTAMNEREAPYIAVSEKAASGETRIMVGIRGHERRRMLTVFSRLLDSYGLRSQRKYIEVFKDHARIHSFYFKELSPATLEGLTRDINVALMLPDSPVAALFHGGTFLPECAMYAVCGAAFTHQFLSTLTDDYETLRQALRDQPEARGIVDNLKLRLVKDSFSSSRIAATLTHHSGIVERLYRQFRDRFAPGADHPALEKAAEAIRGAIARDVPYSMDRTILDFLLKFNHAVEKTNFFKPEKTCMAFRVDPGVLDPADFRERPFGLYFIVGREFLGFHVRFRDIARGGIRIVQSRNIDLYAHNLDTIFFENYNLALTQQRKNKDIPEGGAKGTVLLHLVNQDEAEKAFKAYVDGLLDLLVPSTDLTDLRPREEILFLGPDEGTAGLMDWASEHARRRGYRFWKAFSTGKAPESGGVPHDLYGMTTIGVHAYVLGILKKQGIEEAEITKIQTGGPDGDLGSNEILISKDRTLGVVDVSGVLYDPAGIDRKELRRLARRRVTIDRFDRAKLSARGFFVAIGDRDVVLPDKTKVANGEEFRNLFHLGSYAKADLFVPCGGRPGAVNIRNWRDLFDESDKPKFRFIVEGANLFLTEPARLRLEERGVVVFKDASTNKGGVTSSSLEVLVSLALTDKEYDRHMRVVNGKMPPFRAAYIRAVIRAIKRNAEAEFELLWYEHHVGKTPLSELSNRVSEKINSITDAIATSKLPDDPKLAAGVIRGYTPEPLVDLIGIANLVRRVPPNYIRALVSTRIATEFVYRKGLAGTEVDFADYVAGLRR